MINDAYSNTLHTFQSQVKKKLKRSEEVVFVCYLFSTSSASDTPQKQAHGIRHPFLHSVWVIVAPPVISRPQQTGEQNNICYPKSVPY